MKITEKVFDILCNTLYSINGNSEYPPEIVGMTDATGDISQLMCDTLARELRVYANREHGTFWRIYVKHSLEALGFDEMQIANALKDLK